MSATAFGPARMMYFDNNATTAIDPSVLRVMDFHARETYGNPSSPHAPGRAAALALDEARSRVASLIGARSDEIVFTSGGTESNVAAIRSALANRPGRRHIVASAIEHASVRETILEAEKGGYRVTWIPATAGGSFDATLLDRLVDDDTALVVVMAANNETGVILPYREAARAAHARGALFHTDAVQAAGKIPVDVASSEVDTLSFCAHKMHGPKGVGALYVRTGAPFLRLLPGGDQEHGHRAGTENVPLIAAFGAACSLARERLAETASYVALIRDRFEDAVLAAIPGVTVIGAAERRLPNTSLVLIPGVETEALLARLDMDGMCCSSGSACASGAHEPSRVLRAMNPAGLGDSAVLRTSFSRFNTPAEADSLVSRLVLAVKELRGSGRRASASRPV